LSEDWNAIAAEVDTALKSIGSTDAGFLATLTQTSTTGGDPWNPGSGTTTTTTVNTSVAIVLSEYRKDEIDSTLILSKDRKVMMTATAGVEPKPSDVLTISGVAHNVVNVSPLSPAGVVVMYELQARA